MVLVPGLSVSSYSRLSLVISAKEMDDRGMLLFQKFLFIEILILTPVYTGLIIPSEFVREPAKGALTYASAAAAAILLISVLAGSTFHLFKAIIWLRTKRNSNALYSRISYKTNWLIAINFCFFVTLVIVIWGAVSPEPSLKILFGEIHCCFRSLSYA